MGKGIDCRTITINSGTVNANGEDEGIHADSVTISGGSVTATAEGIDSYGIYASVMVTITGGNVIATAEGTNGYGIFTNGSVTISGGTVTANGKDYGIIAPTGFITISGGTVTANGQVCGICTNGSATITGGSVKAMDGTGTPPAEGGIGAVDPAPTNGSEAVFVKIIENTGNIQSITVNGAPYNPGSGSHPGDNMWYLYVPANAVVEVQYKNITPPPEKYTLRTLTDPATGVTVTGLMTIDTALTVETRHQHTAGTCEACDEIYARAAADELILYGDIALNGDYKGDLTVSIPVDAKYNGQTVTILHCNNGKLEGIDVVVSNGYATGTFPSLSPFAVVTARKSLSFSLAPPTLTGGGTAGSGSHGGSGAGGTTSTTTNAPATGQNDDANPSTGAVTGALGLAGATSSIAVVCLLGAAVLTLALKKRGSRKGTKG